MKGDEMADYDVPEDLIKLRVDWLTADAHCQAIATEDPTGQETITTRPITAADQPRTIRLMSAEQSERLAAARAERQRLTLEIHRHPWKAAQTSDGRTVHGAEDELRRIALERYKASPTAN
jgi:hypothetical protein